MPLPETIEIVPLRAIPTASITVPGSKSITNRALVLAALGRGQTTLRGALWSEDTQVMVECLRALGFAVSVAPDPVEAGNRTITVAGRGGSVPVGSPGKTTELFVGNAGTAARFLAALVCLGQGVYRLHGVPRMHERPQAALFQALRRLGYRVETPNDRLPATIFGRGSLPGRCVVSIQESSQFASALLLSAGIGQWDVQVQGENAEESPYVEMTRQLAGVFPAEGGDFQIEPDASSGSYFWAVNALGEPGAQLVKVNHWPESGWQVDARFPGFLPLNRPLSRAKDLGDSIMTAIVLAPLARQPLRFTDLGRLRVQECERVQALRVELAKCGAAVREKGDTLEFIPGPLHGAEIETYQDHRMAMCFAILGLKVPGIRLQNPACVKKTFPNFFQKLAAPPPEGLGARLLDGRTGNELTVAELAAE
jgi:3-phosphoshikimate 1-carboxyvinyltransferase